MSSSGTGYSASSSGSSGTLSLSLSLSGQKFGRNARVTEYLTHYLHSIRLHGLPGTEYGHRQRPPDWLNTTGTPARQSKLSIISTKWFRRRVRSVCTMSTIERVHWVHKWFRSAEDRSRQLKIQREMQQNESRRWRRKKKFENYQIAVSRKRISNR